MQIEVLVDASDHAAAMSLATLHEVERDMGSGDPGLHRPERLQTIVLVALVQQLEAIRYAILASVAEEHVG